MLVQDNGEREVELLLPGRFRVSPQMAGAIKAAPRIGMVYSFNPKTVLRGGWGLY